MATATLIPKAIDSGYADAIHRACDTYGVDQATREELLHWFDHVQYPLVTVPPADEAIAAQRDRAVKQLRQVLAHLVDRKAHMFGGEQAVLNAADALLVEAESW